MPHVVSFVNLKGGVGKTTQAVAFAQYCGRRGKRTLLIDLDPQTNATFSCIDIDIWQQHAKLNGTIADLLGVRRHTSATGTVRGPASVIRPNVFQGVDLIPSHLDLFTVDLDLASATAREFKLKNALASTLAKYDIVVCDCPPNLTIPTQNALAFSTHYVVPISPDYLSGLGVGLLMPRIKQLGADLGNEIKHAGIIISRVGRPAQHREQTVATLRTEFGSLVFSQEIHERVKVSEAAALKRSVFDMGDTEAVREFSSVCQEILSRLV